VTLAILNTYDLFLMNSSHSLFMNFFAQVFDLNQALNSTYLQSQLFHHYSSLPQLSQLLSDASLAIVLNSTHSSLVRPLDTLTNTLVSPLFYGLQSLSVSDAQGRVTLAGVRVLQNLPGAWTLQCGVDGSMMDTPVLLHFSSYLSVSSCDHKFAPSDFLCRWL
jgi:hypothetical protein